jgi:anti-sigma regulatory factor (Ser/Thr protein kinase)
MKLTIALHEALSNSVVHGNLEISSDLKEQGEEAFAQALAARCADPRFVARSVDILMDYDGQRCQWILTDEGKGFDVQKILARNPQDEEMLLKPSGRGILMMKAFLDEVRYEAGGRRVILTVRKIAGQEKRRHPRQSVQQRLRIAPLREDGSVDWQAAYDAVSRNYCAEGIAFLQERLAVCNRIIIGVDSEGGPLYLPAEVRHWRALDGDVVELGCRFPGKTADVKAAVADPMGRPVEEAIGTLIEQFQGEQVAQTNRRQHPRVVYTERIEIRDDYGKQTLVGFARDLSRGGLAFITTNTLPLGPAHLTLPQGQNKPPLKVRVQIVRCVSIMEGFFDVGAKFLEQERHT